MDGLDISADVDGLAGELDVLVIGAGFAGLYLLDRLRTLGHRVAVFEAGADLGGIWHWNCYPGARVDSTGAIYQYSRQDLWRDWDYDELYPSWKELRRYFDYVDGKLDLRRDIRFNARIQRAVFDDRTCRWIVTAADGTTTRARFVVVCTGFAAKPYIPTLPGLSDFAGVSHHTALWPQEGVDFRGKRVGVLGTGSSGVQVVQEAAKEASHLVIFQRTPNLALPMRQQALDAEAARALKAGYERRLAMRTQTFAGFDYDLIPRNAIEVPEAERTAIYEALWEKGGFGFWLGTFAEIFSDERSNRTAYNFWRDKVRARLADPVLAEKLAPTNPPHPFGLKRPALEQTYYDVFAQPNVQLVDLREQPVIGVTSGGVQTQAAHHDLDVLVLATGFDALTGGLTSIDICGPDGTSLRESWAAGVRTHLGIATQGFPNLLYVYGPQSPSAFCNGPTCAEVQGDWVVDCLEHLRSNGLSRIEATEAAQEAWREHVGELGDASLFFRAESWYVGANVPGKTRELLAYPGGLPLYLSKCAECADTGYAGFVLA